MGIYITVHNTGESLKRYQNCAEPNNSPTDEFDCLITLWPSVFTCLTRFFTTAGRRSGVQSTAGSKYATTCANTLAEIS